MKKQEAWKSILFLILFPVGLGVAFAMGFSPFSHAYLAYGALVVLFFLFWVLRSVKAPQSCLFASVLDGFQRVCPGRCIP